MIGTKVSRYKILRKLGEGGEGAIYLAEDSELGRRVILEFLSKQLASDTEALDRFRRQAQAVGALDHPNLVTVYEIGTHEGVPFIAMEYVRGQTLADSLAHETTPPHEAIDIAIQLCDGLSAAHREGVFFRDIRPEKILIGEGGRIRIADIGQTAEDRSPVVSLETRSLIDSGLTRGAGEVERSSVRSVGRLLQKLDTENRFEEIVSRAVSDSHADPYRSVETLAEDLQDTRDRLFGTAHKTTTARRFLWPAVAAVLIVVAALVFLALRNQPDRGTTPAAPEPQRRIIAVLPFENLGDAEDEYFADGITDEITSRLALVQGLGVISRTSARVYKGTQRSVREIGAELNADYVLEGTIRWDRSRGEGRVRITPQLIQVSDDTHVWSRNYEREMTEIFSVQSEIASQIAEALDVKLLANERQALAVQPTDNIDAYQAYLQGMKLLRAPDFSRESFELGLQMFSRAVELDPQFALAHARLSSMHSRMVHFGYDRSEHRLALAVGAANRALELQPDLAEAHLALGLYHYWGRRDYDRALASLEAARERAPGNSEIPLATAYVIRRQGDLEGAIELFERDLELSPLDPNAVVGLGETYGTLRRYAEAERAFKRGIALAPDNAYPYTELALLYLRGRGDTETARDYLDQMPSVAGTESCRVGFFVELMGRRYEAALERLESCPDRVLEAGAFFIPIPMYEGMTLRLMGDEARATAAFEQATAVLEERLAQYPQDHRIHSALGQVYAALGRGEDAIRHGRRAVELYPLSKDALEAPVLMTDLALTYTLVGDHDAAIEQLDEVLSIPSILSTAWLEKDPQWDPLREHPGYAALLREHPVDW
jgi:TolB-like protein/Flp pilus assembly protein TadD